MQTKGDIADARHAIGMRIRHLRKSQGLSQYKFSNMIGLNRTYLIGVERGYRNVSVDNLLRIAQGLGVEPAKLFDGVDVPTSIDIELQVIEPEQLPAVTGGDMGPRDVPLLESAGSASPHPSSPED